jgi:hypothetical protein
LAAISAPHLPQLVLAVSGLPHSGQNLATRIPAACGVGFGPVRAGGGGSGPERRPQAHGAGDPGAAAGRQLLRGSPPGGLSQGRALRPQLELLGGRVDAERLGQQAIIQGHALSRSWGGGSMRGMPKVFANGRSILHAGDGLKHTSAVPDVCKTPSPGGPIPVPYVNVASDSDLAKGTQSVHIEGNSVAIASSNLSTSMGDEPGTAGEGSSRQRPRAS